VALPINNNQPDSVATRSIRETRASKLAAKERRVAAKASKVPYLSTDMHLPMLKHIAELLKRRKAIAIEIACKKGMGILKELMDENIEQFPWLIRNTMNHYTSAYLEEDYTPMVIYTHYQTGMSEITDSSSVNSALLRSTIRTVSETPT
jgi:hypothetical protein